jgi:hypothetical protein
MTESADTRIITESLLRAKTGWANVEDYLDPNRVPGITDDRAAFEQARLTGKPVRAGTGMFYLSKSPDWGNNAVFKGAGRGRTIIKLLDNAPADVTLWGNASLNGTTQGYFADFTLDGNCQRQGGTLQAAGGSRSSCLTLRNVNYFYIDRVEAINPIQHGFDVTRGHLDYPYVGDGVLATLRSSNVYFDKCVASNFGDDGFTTHSSDYVHFSRCFAYNPRLRGNCNGFEIDGDSRHVTLTNNRSFGCYAGVEIKGHGSESAAQHTTINGHHDTGSVRSYNFRHIGYQEPQDPVSKSATGITCTNLVAIDNNNDKGFQDDATPRALSVSAFQDVTINGFLVKGRGGYSTGAIAVQLQYRASATINGLQITGWKGAELDMSLTTSGRVSVQFAIWDSANNAVYVGASVASAKLEVSRLTAPATGGGTGLDIYNSTNVEVTGTQSISGYTVPIRSDLSNFANVGVFARRTRAVPAGVTSMKNLDPAFDYYASTATFAAFTTDRPSGASGAYFITHSRSNGDMVVQTITRNTTGTPVQYWRLLNHVSFDSSPWQQVNTTVVANSAT